MHDENLRREVMQYYSEKREALPAHFYFKRRNKAVIDFMLESVKKESYHIKGDVNEYFRRKLPMITSSD